MPSQTLIERSVNSVKWNSINSIATIVLGLFQTILLARLLPVATFGVYTAAVSVIALTRVISNFGMGSAFLNRSPETMDLDRIAANHFTISLLLTVVWAVLVLAGVLIFVDPSQAELKQVFIVLIFSDIAVQLTNTHRTILVRHVQHQRLALLNLTAMIVTAIISIALALLGFTIWALLASNLVNAILNVIFLVVWRPVWRLRLEWNPVIIRYLLNYGFRTFISRLLLDALDRIDDLWTVTFLGTEALGYYSRAYRFATYPRAFVAKPIYLVAGGTYAELKEDRERLSKAFVRINSFMIRSGFLLAGFLALIAPEFIKLALGEKWLPVLDAFRLMIVYTLFDPVKQTIAKLFNVVGQPEIVMRIRAIQLVVMAIGLFLLGSALELSGVALAVDIMLVTGIILLFRQAKMLVDYSIKSMLMVPTIALIFGLIAGLTIAHRPEIAGNDLLIGLAKTIVYAGVYGSILLIWDRQQVGDMIALIRRYLLKR